MNQKIWNRLSATVLATGLGLMSSSAVATASPLSGDRAEPNRLSETITDPQRASLSVPTESAIAQIQPHNFDERPAATLYVRNIPILTFLGNAADTTGESPKSRAIALADRINQLAAAGTDANSITATWLPDGDRYVIQVGQEILVELDANTILPDMTANLADDTLQATNRLRRVMGNAAPLQQIAGTAIAQVRSTSRPKVAPKTIPPETPQEPILFRMDGWASWYGPGFDGATSANGEIFDQYALTAAHRDLPFDTLVRVTNLDNGRSVIVRINDRGPFLPDRDIDLSAGAAEEIGMMASGTAPVAIEVLGSPQSMTPSEALPKK